MAASAIREYESAAAAADADWSVRVGHPEDLARRTACVIDPEPTLRRLPALQKVAVDDHVILRVIEVGAAHVEVVGRAPRDDCRLVNLERAVKDLPAVGIRPRDRIRVPHLRVVEAVRTGWATLSDEIEADQDRQALA